MRKKERKKEKMKKKMKENPNLKGKKSLQQINHLFLLLK